MERKKVLYFGNFKGEVHSIDQDILYSLKKNSDVIAIDLREFKENEDLKIIVDKANKCDLFLFHAFVPETNELYSQLVLERFVVMLEAIKCKKVLWFLDKIVGFKMKIITTLYDSLDLIFLADETWLRRFDSDKMFSLHPAASNKVYKGKFKKELSCNIAMLGSLYGERVKQYEFLKKRFGDSFKFFDDKYERDYADVCKSAKIVIVPQFPFDDFYWSDRIYTILNNGGFCVHPRTYGLTEEGFKDGKHYVDYYSEQDLFITLKMLIEDKSLRNGISKEGKEFIKGYTYEDRLEDIFKKL